MVKLYPNEIIDMTGTVEFEEDMFLEPNATAFKSILVGMNGYRMSGENTYRAQVEYGFGDIHYKQNHMWRSFTK